MTYHVVGGPWALAVAESPKCPTHGQMSARAFIDADGGRVGVGDQFSMAMAIEYTCAGFDGEGCDYTAPAEFRIIGEVDNMEFEWPTQ
jgi:hypothetical protein